MITAAPPRTKQASQAKSIFLIDDHPLVRAGLRALISAEKDLAVIGETDRFQGAVDAVKAADPDLVLLDLTLPDGSGYVLLKDLRAADVKCPVLVLSMHAEDAFAERALKSGAKGYIMKQAPPENVIKAIREVLDGGVYVSSVLAQQMVKQLCAARTATQASGVEILSEREFEIFQLIAQGIPTRKMAVMLSISPRTVEAHRIHIRTKLGIPDSAQLVRYAIQWFENRMP